jgi:ADP-ribose pyrophosphatase YjhB (NUDIX family)
MEDLTFRMVSGKFNLRVAAVIIRESKILVMSDNECPYFYLPGGRVSLHETSENAIRREIAEELNENIEYAKLIWTVENFFIEMQHGEDIHEICFFYQCELNAESRIYKDLDFTTLETGRINHFKWVPIDKLESLDVVPKFLKVKLSVPIEGVQHFVFNQDARHRRIPME